MDKVSKCPSGWGPVVKHWEKHHKDDIENPYGLAWYMEKQGKKPPQPPFSEQSSVNERILHGLPHTVMASWMSIQDFLSSHDAAFGPHGIRLFSEVDRIVNYVSARLGTPELLDIASPFATDVCSLHHRYTASAQDPAASTRYQRMIEANFACLAALDPWMQRPRNLDAMARLAHQKSRGSSRGASLYRYMSRNLTPRRVSLYLSYMELGRRICRLISALAPMLRSANRDRLCGLMGAFLSERDAALMPPARKSPDG